ncbi:MULTISPECIES: TrkH family potassium uptake protein [Methanobacterium]|uniref:TrkH family potassium uptake protein n=1 Tax=Methanobacterium veterum TaxID=408577 RepID=A0A9E5A285_9EURY|nr:MULTISPECIES: TrkH family potassium uptake protein [Methanobacterium]MCZ3365468.1 TrkH family potassium uptake protein [Methanobacterium veterum]MCZ3373219.1 TrkH family potassium uptake protein [Methanobacterium veterum]
MIGQLRKKDFYIVLEQLGLIMIGIGVVTLTPIVVALIYNEPDYLSFIIPSGFSILIGYILRRSLRGKNRRMGLKHAMMIAALAWLWAALIGSLILMNTTHINFLNAYFESMSAWTGSGLSIFTNVEILPRSVLFLRSIEQWIGGLGVVIVVIGILIRPGTAAARLYKSEAREEKIKPSILGTVKTIWWIYIFYTVLGVILYVLAGMSIFDAINNTFTNLSTGGMSVRNDNIGAYNSTLIYIITIFLMFVGGTSFLIHYKALKGKFWDVLKDIQFRAMVLIIAIFSILLILNSTLVPVESIFNVVSAISCTGSSISPLNTMIAWLEYIKLILIACMIIGGAAGSTAGALKIIRVVTALKGIYWDILKAVSPEGSVIPRKISNKLVSDVEIKEATSYAFIYFIFIFISWLVFVAYGYDALNSLYEIVSAQGNVGLSMGIASPTMPQIPQAFMIFNMWIGRLEIIPVLVLIRASLGAFKRF